MQEKKCKNCIYYAKHSERCNLKNRYPSPHEKMGVFGGCDSFIESQGKLPIEY